MASGRPESTEFAPYYKRYVDQVSSSDILAHLSETWAEATDFYEKIPAEKWNYKYGEDKWTIKEVLQHIADTECIFAYRMMRISRGDDAPLAGFDQNLYINHVNLENRSPESILNEFKSVRGMTMNYLRNMDDADWNNLGTASASPVSTRALAYLIAGHEQHHRQILRERYFD